MIGVSCKIECESKTSIVKAFSFCRGDYCLLRDLMTETPFTRNCYSNIDVMVDEWYSWLLDLIQKSVPIRTKHQQSLPPWISPSTSNLMKKRNCSKETESWRPSFIRFNTQSTKAFARVRRSRNQRQENTKHRSLIVEILLQYSNTSSLSNLTDQLFLHF